MRVCLIGTRRNNSRDDSTNADAGGVEWITLSPRRGTGLGSILTGLPKDAYLLAPYKFRRKLGTLLNQHWDWIVIDHANSSGLLPTILRARTKPNVCYIAHNAEGIVRRAVAKAAERLLPKTVMLLDAEKYRRMEIKTVQAASVVMCISDVDAKYFSRYHGNVHVVPPVFLGKGVKARNIDQGCPRALLLVGSFDWIAKQRNLEQIAEIIGPVLQEHGIALDIIGSVPRLLKERLGRQHPCLRFHGPLADFDALVNKCRGGLLAEVLGGGFKLKLLDYVFMRLPIFGLDHALAGTTAEERSAMFVADDMKGLARLIIDNIDKIDQLNWRQNQLYDLARERFSIDRAVQRVNRIFHDFPVDEPPDFAGRVSPPPLSSS